MQHAWIISLDVDTKVSEGSTFQCTDGDVRVLGSYSPKARDSSWTKASRAQQFQKSILYIVDPLVMCQ
jgi:hypothetical protein